MTSRQDLECSIILEFPLYLSAGALDGHKRPAFTQVLLKVNTQGYLSFVTYIFKKKKNGILKIQSKTDSGDILEGLCRGLRTWKNDPVVCSERDLKTAVHFREVQGKDKLKLS